MKHIKRVVLVTLGWIFLGTGVVGIFLPLLPTTPLLLLSALCFFHGSEKWYHWLITHKRFGKPIRYYRTYRMITLQAKVMSLLLLWSSITCSALLLVTLLWVRILLFGIAVAVSVYILSLKTLTSALTEEQEDEMQSSMDRRQR